MRKLSRSHTDLLRNIGLRRAIERLDQELKRAR